MKLYMEQAMQKQFSVNVSLSRYATFPQKKNSAQGGILTLGASSESQAINTIILFHLTKS